MKRIVISGILLFILIVFLIIFFTRIRSPFGKSNSSFASEPKEEISRIEFSQNGKRLVLENDGENWFVNGKSEARKNGINFILRVLKEIRIKSPVSQELFTKEISGKKIDPVKVRIYEKKKNLSTFLVYKTQSNVYGNVMKIRESSKPFIVYVPGYEGDIGSAFTLNELFWQPYTVFNLLPSEIATVKFEHVSDTAASFTIQNRNHHYLLNNGIAGWDSARVIRYLSYFAYIPFESWVTGISPDDQKSIESTQPLYTITVVTTDGKKTILTLWQMIIEKEGKKQVDSDRMYGKTDEREDLFIIRYFDIDPVIKKREYFF